MGSFHQYRASDLLCIAPFFAHLTGQQTIQTAVLQAQNDTITVDDLEIGSEQTTFPTSFTLRNDEEDKERILRALKQAKGNKKLAAKMLGIGRSTLYNKLDEYGLNEEN